MDSDTLSVWIHTPVNSKVYKWFIWVEIYELLFQQQYVNVLQHKRWTTMYWLRTISYTGAKL